MAFNAVPVPQAGHVARGYGPSAASDFANPPAHPTDLSPPGQHHVGRFNEDFDASVRGSSILDGDTIHRSSSRASQRSLGGAVVSRSGTLKKKGSVSRKGSLKRSGSRRSIRAGSIKGMPMGDETTDPESFNNIFNTPVPTSGTPTDILVNRFQAWRKLLKDLITYFREVQSSYEARSKALMKVSNAINNTNAPSLFLADGGINDANRILRDYHKQSVVESNKARDIESDVITQLSGLRADLGSKIKEIKSLSGDFKNSVEKEKEVTRKAVAHLEDALAAVDVDPSAVVGKGDPFVVRLAVDRQIERQIDEENYLHRAYLNLEGSGRELESIVVGEIQKAYNALAGVLKRDADEVYDTVERLRAGPISMPKDREWTQFVEHDPHFVNPRTPLRRIEDIEYPGKHHPAAAEIRAGMLERKSKYLKSYTPGWYVLSPTHLHEFKSADRIYTQPPVMSLYLPDQKLGTHSQPGSSSHKFILKGRQAGSMHRGHTWVFRAESYDTMKAWYEDIKSLTEKSGEERNAFVRNHSRSISAGSARSVSSDGLDDNEADEVPYSAQNSDVAIKQHPAAPRPQPGGRFPSDLTVNRDLQAPLSPSSGSSEADHHDLTTAAGGLRHEQPETSAYYGSHESYQPQEQYFAPAPGQGQASYQHQYPPAQTQAPYEAQHIHQPQPQQVYPAQASLNPANEPDLRRHNSTTTYSNWLTPAAGGAAAGALGAEAYMKPKENPGPSEAPKDTQEEPSSPLEPAPGMTAASAVSFPSSTRTSSYADTLDSEAPAMATTVAADSGHPATIFANAAAANGATNGNAKRPSGAGRNHTDVSVSQLHVPGEYPRTPMSQ
ncbi:ph domain protein [Diplodia corticola]|uniref:Ph domain protein n=1 Tax=Diplodia corticola TaxID=236234 RepID=A0A1J9RZJ2_9PEZI|nr:ph domain protein [Diplodia corticola]OJD38091.1 ph domain protein [Diplodia corticola]